MKMGNAPQANCPSRKHLAIAVEDRDIQETTMRTTRYDTSTSVYRTILQHLTPFTNRVKLLTS